MKTRTDDAPAARTTSKRAAAAAIGLLVGFVLAIVLLWAWRGNPFSSADEVTYREVVVGSVTDDEESICWAEDPDRRDSPQECAILTIDPALEVPESGDVVTIGVVELHPPDGGEMLQVVHVAAAQGGTAGGGADPTPTATSSPSG